MSLFSENTMFYELTVKGYIRVPPKNLGENLREAIMQTLQEEYADKIIPELGFILDVVDVLEIGEGVIIPGDGAAYYETKFKLLVFKPEMQEIVLGKVKEVAEFGVFLEIGPVDGMIHISQTMDDYVSFSKSGELHGKETKKNLKVNDKCRARIIAISYRDVTNPKIGLTMRQPGLGALRWYEEKK